MFRRWEMVDGVPYKNVKSKIDKADLDFVTRFALWQESQPPGHFATRDVTVIDPQSPGTYAAYNEPVFGYLYNNLHPLMEEITGLTLLPTYWYHRVYRPGAILVEHTDRPACEVSASLLVGTTLPSSWPLWIAGKKIDQKVGDMVIYRGIEDAHWREPLDGPEGVFQVQLFMHYVDANGPYTMCVGDQDDPRDDNVIDAAVAESRHNYDEAVQEGRMLI